MFHVPNEMVERINAQPTFLRVKPDGFDDGSTLRRTVIIVKPLGVSTVIKLFENNVLVHTSEDCGSNPACLQCKRGRPYLRLRVELDGREYRLDLTPTASARLAAVTGSGIKGLLRMTCTRAEGARGMVWGEIGFEIVKEAA
ncbi:hypothetical protein L6V77_03575 [Myxococcota bacterium]|nr:hypothetical protein [Myxococcota bacterium]